VRVYNDEGRLMHYARVNLYVYQFLASGQYEQYTDSDGETEFDLDTDEFAEISISVNGNERVKRGSIRGEYRISA
jgi:uncharacterized protein YciU (UPF0263 family)